VTGFSPAKEMNEKSKSHNNNLGLERKEEKKEREVANTTPQGLFSSFSCRTGTESVVTALDEIGTVDVEFILNLYI